MPEPKHITPVAIPKCTKGAALSNQKKLRAAYRKFGRAWFQLGVEVDKAIRRGEHTALGLTFDEWAVQTFGDSGKKLERAIRSTRALAGLPAAKLAVMTEGNAWELSRLPEKTRKSPEWVENAVVLPNDTFKKEVDQALQKKQTEPREIFKTWRVSLPEAVYEMVVEAERKAAAAMQLDIVEKPARRLLVWERFAKLILDSSEAQLRDILTGEESESQL